MSYLRSLTAFYAGLQVSKAENWQQPNYKQVENWGRPLLTLAGKHIRTFTTVTSAANGA